MLYLLGGFLDGFLDGFLGGFQFSGWKSFFLGGFLLPEAMRKESQHG